MNTHKLYYIEDYICFIAGYVDRNLRSTSFLRKSPISLARYDVKIIDSMALQSLEKVAFTDKQASLSQRLVSKYKKQLAGLEIDITDIVINPVFKNGIRTIDREQSLTIVNDQLVLKFPYNTEIIPKLSSLSKENQGTIFFDADKKLWKASPTEFNVSSFYAIAEANKFKISEEVSDLMKKILEVETQDYKIELIIDKETNELQITNAQPSLINYINDNLGGLVFENIDVLVDNSSLLGYTVSEDIMHLMHVHHGKVNSDLMESRYSHIMNLSGVPTKEVLQKVYNYAKMTNRWPVYVYTINEIGNADLEFVFGNTNVLTSSTKNVNDYTGKCIVLRTNLRRSWDKKIPILVTTNIMVTTSMRYQLALYAEKIVYYTHTMYNDFDVRKIMF